MLCAKGKGAALQLVRSCHDYATAAVCRTPAICRTPAPLPMQCCHCTTHLNVGHLSCEVGALCAQQLYALLQRRRAGRWRARPNSRLCCWRRHVYISAGSAYASRAWRGPEFAAGPPFQALQCIWHQGGGLKACKLLHQCTQALTGRDRVRRRRRWRPGCCAGLLLLLPLPMLAGGLPLSCRSLWQCVSAHGARIVLRQEGEIMCVRASSEWRCAGSALKLLT